MDGYAAPATVAPVSSPLPEPASSPATSQASTAPYILSATREPGLPLPTFWLSGAGDLRAMASQAGLQYDPGARRCRAPTPYHARLLWCYADPDADAALRSLFPRFGRPARPRRVPFVMAANDRIICLTSPETAERPRSAGFVFNPSGQYWETRDVRRVLPLADIAEEDLQRRLEAVAPLPFDTLADVTIRDLISLSDSESGGTARHKPEDGASDPVLTFDDDRGLFVCRHSAAQGAGFRKAGQEFVTNDFSHAQRMRAFATEKAELRLQAEAMIRTVPDPNAPDPRPVPQSPTAPFPFGPDQLKGVRFMATRSGAIVADEMGVGKTAEAFGLINVECPRLAVVCVPANLLDNWLAEAALWLAPPNKAAIFGRGKDRDTLPPDANVLLVSYEMLPKLLVLLGIRPDLLICDEAQEIKSEATKAGRIIYGHLVPAAGKFVPMTGTPVWNRPQDLWAPLHAIAPEVFPHKRNFLALYRVSDPENVTPKQQQRLDFLAHLLKSGLMIRRLKDDVLDLPPKRHVLVPVNLPPHVLASLSERNAAVEQAEEEARAATGRAAVTKQRTLFSELARLRREVGEAKYDFVRDYVLDFCRQHADAERPRPPVVFGRHRHLLRRFSEDLSDAGLSPALLTGDAGTRARQKRVNEFQAGKANAAVAGYDAAGVGYTMIRSCDVFMFEVDYTPALMKQAIDRLHRRGQDRECTVYWFVVDNTIDARIARLFVAKDQVAQHALGDHLVGMFPPTALLQHPVFTAPVAEN